MRFLRSFLILMSFSALPMAAKAEDARSVMEDFLGELRSFWVPLNNSNSNFSSRRTWTRNLVNDRFDFAQMTRSSMGNRWNRMNENEQVIYRELFHDALVETAIDWFNAYDGEDFEILSVRNSGRNTDVRTRFTRANGQRIDSTWITRETGGRFLIRDVRVAGLSLVADFRGRYGNIIDREGMDGFFERLESDTARLRASQR